VLRRFAANWAEINIVEFIELLWCKAKYSDSCAPVRAKLFDDAVVPSQEQFTTFALASTEVRRQYPKFDLLLPAMDRLAQGLTRCTAEISATDYLESLLVVVKEANFTAPLREQLLQKALPEGGCYRM
jgi:hypothetical protein